MKELAVFINKKREEAENIYHIMSIQDRMIGKYEVTFETCSVAVLIDTPQSLVTPGRKYIFEGSVWEIEEKRGALLNSAKNVGSHPHLVNKSPNSLDMPRPKHRRNRSMGSIATISHMIVREKDKEKDNSLGSIQTGKKHERYCFVFDDLLILAKRANIGTLFSEPGTALMFLTKKTKSKFRNDRKEINWASLAGGGSASASAASGDDDAADDASFQYYR